MKVLSKTFERRMTMKLQHNSVSRIPLADERIIALYWERDENAIEETDFKYGSYLQTVARNILGDSLDCEECLNDTYLGTWNAIPPARPNVLKAFLTTIARRIAIKRYHSRTRQRRIPSEMTVSLSELEDFIACDDDVDSHFDAARLGNIVSDFVRSLPERRQFIFMSRYYAAEPINRIASDLSLSRSTVNKELAAIRGDLKKKLESEGYSI